MRYLGLELNDLNKNTSHLNKRRMLSYACLSRITASGIYLKKQTNPRQIVQLYKTYIRPILFFGCENFFYEKTELSKISTVDGNILKTMIGIPIQCHHTDLQLAFGMDSAEQYIAYSRAKFIKRLNDNAYTREIMIFTLNNQIKNSMTDKYFNTHKVNENERSYNKLIEIVEEEIDKFKSFNKNRKDKSFYFNSKVSSIRKLADDFETIDFHDELFKLIKYEDSA